MNNKGGISETGREKPRLESYQRISQSKSRRAKWINQKEGGKP